LEEFSRQRDGMMQLKSNAERDAPIVDDEGNAVTVEVMSIESTVHSRRTTSRLAVQFGV
jgi:hypothetical protein